MRGWCGAVTSKRDKAAAPMVGCRVQLHASNVFPDPTLDTDHRTHTQSTNRVLSEETVHSADCGMWQVKALWASHGAVAVSVSFYNIFVIANKAVRYALCINFA